MDAMDAKTAVSIIIPFYNGIDWLEMIFVALGKQTFKDFEVIVADDGSREDVVARLEELMARQPFPVTHLWQEDCGFRKNRMLNKAVVQSRTEYLNFPGRRLYPAPEIRRGTLQGAAGRVRRRRPEGRPAGRSLRGNECREGSFSGIRAEIGMAVALCRHRARRETYGELYPDYLPDLASVVHPPALRGDIGV